MYSAFGAHSVTASDEDFSLVMEDGPKTMEGTLKELNKFKAERARLVQEQVELCNARDEQRDLVQQFKQRSDRLRASLQEDEISHAKEANNEKDKLASLHQEESKLKREIERAQGELFLLQKNNCSLKQQTDVSTAVPEKKVVFTGETGDGVNTATFDMKPSIVFPMEGGTALITFEDDDVAQKILELKKHNVVETEGSECTITVEAKPVHLMMPDCVEMDSQVCPRRILVSDLPQKVSEEILLDKLELHFNKSKNGGGEVDDKDFLDDSGNVVITFVESNIAKHLTQTQYHNVFFGKSFGTHKVKATPFLNGEIIRFEPKMSECSRTVLLTGIPAIMEQETLQDMLEIHFQKSSNGGGEVEAILYNPVGQCSLALFQEDCPDQA